MIDGQFLEIMQLLQALVAVLGFSIVPSSAAQCRCTPIDSCWNSLDWNALNATVSGKLIRNTPPALPCYPGPEYNEQECEYVNSQWSNTTFQAVEPIGYTNPLDNSCPVVNQTARQLPWPHNCSLGPSPVYTINATEPEDLVAGIAFAQESNVRLVVRNTGHDLLGKSTGYGSLQVWMRYLRKGITHQAAFKPFSPCAKCDWAGAAFTVAGGYVWEDVYEKAFARDLIVVGGGDPTVSVIGGYIQGGGHSPATRDFGLASDQILEAQVILAGGTIVIANPCSHPDLFTALRGGGGGTYGVVVSVTIKAFPSKPVVAHSLVITPQSPHKLDSFLDAIADLYSAFPAISDSGFSGYGSWSVNDPTGTYANSAAGYQHSLAVLDKPLPAAKASFQTVLERISSYDSINVSIEWSQFPSYSAYYRALSGVRQPTGVPESALASRMFDKGALTSDRDALREVMGVLAGRPKESTINQVLLVGGGKVLEEPEYSGANPAWRKTYLVHIVARGWLEKSGPLTGKTIKADITYNKYQAMRELTPSMGSYLNEADLNNPWWEEDFYGENYDRLLDIKKKYDPEGVFYCPTCVGSSSWFEQTLPGRDFGPLCTNEL